MCDTLNILCIDFTLMKIYIGNTILLFMPCKCMICFRISNLSLTGVILILDWARIRIWLLGNLYAEIVRTKSRYPKD